MNSFSGTYGEQFLCGYGIYAHNNGVGLTSIGVINYAKQFNELKDSIDTLTSAVQSIPTTITASASASSGGGASSEPVVIPQDVPVITVCQNQGFSFVVGYYDDMPNGTSADGLVTVTNSNVGDKVVQLSGRISTKGTHSVVIHGRTFIIKVIDPPTTSSVNVILN